MASVRSEDRGRVRLLTLDGPDRHNCLSCEMAVGLAEAINAFSRDGDKRRLPGPGDHEHDARRAQQLGLVQEVVPEGLALDLAEHMTIYPQASLRADRQATIRGEGLPLAEGLKLELDLTVAVLSSASGVSNGSIYHHFGSKEGVLAALLVGIVEDNQAALLDALDGHDDARGGVVATVEAQLRWVQEHRDDARLLLLEHRDQLAGHGEVRKLNRRFLARTRSWLDRQAQAGRLPALTVEVAHAIVFAPALEVSRLWLTKHRFPAPLTFSASLGRAAWAGLIAVQEQR